MIIGQGTGKRQLFVTSHHQLPSCADGFSTGSWKEEIITLLCTPTTSLPSCSRLVFHSTTCLTCWSAGFRSLAWKEGSLWLGSDRENDHRVAWQSLIFGRWTSSSKCRFYITHGVYVLLRDGQFRNEFSYVMLGNFSFALTKCRESVLFFYWRRDKRNKKCLTYIEHKK